MAEREVLGESIARLLCETPYEKRKQGALEIEAKVRDLLGRQGGRSEVQKIIDVLRHAYVESTQSNYKKGGLIGLASVAIGLEGEIGKFLSQLVLPVLELFKYDEPRVRYYACESLYNISKVANEAVLEHFNDIFDGLCKLYADVDTEVKNGVQILDRLMKDIVTECASSFQVEPFVPRLERHMQFKNPFIRQLVLGWITLLLKVPEVDMVRHVPQFLESLFNMLGDQSRDIRHNADACLNELLKGVSSAQHDKALRIISDTTQILVKCCFAADACSRLTALCWLQDFVRLELEGSECRGRPHSSWVEILPKVLRGTLRCINDHEEEIRRMAVQINCGLLEMAQRLAGEIPVNPLVDELLESIRSREGSRDSVVSTACLQWICMLLEQSPEQMLQRETLHRLLEPIFDTLLHEDDEVVVAALRVLAQIMEGRDAREDGPEDEAGRGNDLFNEVANRLLELFASDGGRMLEARGRLMIRQLCGHLSPRRLYVTVARAIQRTTVKDNPDLAQQLVQTFSWILLTAAETRLLREELLAPLSGAATGGAERPAAAGADAMLRGGEPSAAGAPGPSPQGRPLFLELLEPWFHNPVSALALCLWAQQYELAAELTARLAAFEPTLDLLKQLDQLVHLLESPVFSRLRLRLLEPRQHPALLKCLLGLAMLLPQAGAFGILRERLHVVQGGLLLEAASRDDQREGDSGHRHMLWWSGGPSGARGAGEAGGRGDAELAGLLERFDALMAATQCHHG